MYFNYSGYNTLGQVRKGKIDAGSVDEARVSVAALGVTLTNISKSQDVVLPWSRRSPNLKDKALFTQQFAQLLGGSVPVGESLAVAARTTTNPYLKQTVERIRREVDDGQPLDQVFASKENAKAFDSVFIAFIRMGQASGNLGPPLKELGDMYKWQLRIVGMVKKGLTLPAIIMGACILVTYFIMANVVPTFMKILTGMNAELPAITQAVKNFSELVANPVFTLSLIAVIVGLVYAVMQYRKTPPGRLVTDRLILRAPILGPLMRTFILARLSRAMAVMLKNSIPLADTLLIAASISANEVYAGHLRDMRTAAINGTRMYPVMIQAPKEFPEQFALQFKAAEEKAKLKETLLYLGEVYNDEVTSAVESLTATIEPVLMIFLGSVVGVIVISVFLPMSAMMGALSK